jgi:hypothetical protein
VDGGPARSPSASPAALANRLPPSNRTITKS